MNGEPDFETLRFTDVDADSCQYALRWLLRIRPLDTTAHADWKTRILGARARYVAEADRQGKPRPTFERVDDLTPEPEYVPPTRRAEEPVVRVR